MPELIPPALPADVLFGRSQPLLDGDGLVLRPWTLSDAPAVVAAYADSSIQRWHVRSMTEAEAIAWVGSWPVRWAAGTDASWAVVSRGVLVGRMSFKHVSPADASCEAAYWVVPAARGRGVAAAALRLASSWLLSIGFERLDLLHSVLNLGSCRVAVKAGYELEGTKRRSGLHADGWHDMHLHALVGTTA
ncbi:MAG: GCN5-related N-acetyltransferase [Pseudonocardiales bacterium]|nr:GCN5-related N-acetyltransferase [Pseudonocardiales bacterium]